MICFFVSRVCIVCDFEEEDSLENLCILSSSVVFLFAFCLTFCVFLILFHVLQTHDVHVRVWRCFLFRDFFFKFFIFFCFLFYCGQMLFFQHLSFGHLEVKRFTSSVNHVAPRQNATITNETLVLSVWEIGTVIGNAMSVARETDVITMWR